MVEGTPAATRPARGADRDDTTAPSTSATPLASAMRTPLVANKRLSFSATTPMGSVGRTPGSGIKVTGFDELCAVCYSPLDRAEGERDGAGDVDDVKRELFTTECNHTYHRCCLVRCREADFTLCCLCKTGRIDGKGLTPEHVRERRALNAQRNAVIGAAARGREAVRARYVRAMVNRPSAGARVVAPLMPPVDEEGSPGTIAAATAAAPASPARSVAASSAPATPARGIPVGRGGYPSPAGRGGNSPHLRRSARSSASFDTAGTAGDDEGTPAVFTTAAEELRARAEASAIAVAAAYSTTSAPTTPARHFGTYEPPSVPNSEMRNSATRNSTHRRLYGRAASAADDEEEEEEEARGRRTGDGSHADAREGRRAIDLASVAAALGGGGDWDDADDTAGDDASNSPLNAPSDSFSRPFKSAARELAELGESAHAVMRALIANGTASAPATPLAAGWGDSTVGRPAIAAAVAAAEAGGDAEGRAARLVRRLLEDE